MDCENFDRVVLYLLYEELDDMQSAAVHRHVAHCNRCRQILARLRATLEVGTLPVLAPPAELRDRILVAERAAALRLPARQRVGRAISVLAGYAMRPQLAMGALLILMIGASLLLLQARPGERESVQVTERGVPESESEPLDRMPMAVSRTPNRSTEPATRNVDHRSVKRDMARTGSSSDHKVSATPSPADDSSGDASTAETSPTYQAALTAYREGHYEHAANLFARVAAAGGSEAAAAALKAVHCVREQSGCDAAIAEYDALAVQYANTEVGHDATWHSTECSRSLGDRDAANAGYTALLAVSRYAERAAAALKAQNEEQSVPDAGDSSAPTDSDADQTATESDQAD